MSTFSDSQWREIVRRGNEFQPDERDGPRGLFSLRWLLTVAVVVGAALAWTWA